MKPTKELIDPRDVLDADDADILYLEPDETTVLDDMITSAVLLQLRIFPGDRAEASYIHTMNL